MSAIKTYFFEISSSANERKDERKKRKKKKDINLLVLTS